MNNIFKKIVRPFLGKTWGQKFFINLYLFSLKGMNFGGGVSPKDSGENYVINYVITKINKNLPVIFDVGGNNGEYSKLLLSNLFKANIKANLHIFEPSGFLCEKLKKAFANKAAVHQLAIGETSGQATLFSDKDGSGLASLFKRDIGHAGIAMKEQEMVRVETLDAICQTENIYKIDFLKLDIEGNEFAALKGAKILLENRAIKFIQFEFGGTDIDARVFFKDFYKLLSPNFIIYRILKNGLQQIYRYSELDEIFLTTNYLAELKDA